MDEVSVELPREIILVNAATVIRTLINRDLCPHKRRN